jgi:hypothetical protein
VQCNTSFKEEDMILPILNIIVAARNWECLRKIGKVIAPKWAEVPQIKKRHYYWPDGWLRLQGSLKWKQQNFGTSHGGLRCIHVLQNHCFLWVRLWANCNCGIQCFGYTVFV